MNQRPSDAAAITLSDACFAIQCPCCHRGALYVQGAELECVCCGRRHPIVNGTPVLINDANSVFAAADFLGVESYGGASYGSVSDRTTGFRAAYRKFAHGLGEFEISHSFVDAEAAFITVCRVIPRRPRVLVIGAGDFRWSHSADIVYTDVSFSSGLHAICDAHDLPFADADFDFVLAISVLEHVADPPQVVEEIWRVLKPEGYIYAVTPFLQPVHMGAYDFTRYTYLGHRRLFRKFSDVASGMALGPGAALAASLQALLCGLSDRRAWRRMARLFSLMVGIPLKYLDYATRRTRTAIDGAAGVFFFGQKQASAVSDRDIIGLYRGGFPTTAAAGAGSSELKDAGKPSGVTAAVSGETERAGNAEVIAKNDGVLLLIQQLQGQVQPPFPIIDPGPASAGNPRAWSRVLDRSYEHQWMAAAMPWQPGRQSA
jgi:SAM-dependent methyltransferase